MITGIILLTTTKCGLQSVQTGVQTGKGAAEPPEGVSDVSHLPQLSNCLVGRLEGRLFLAALEPPTQHGGDAHGSSRKTSINREGLSEDQHGAGGSWKNDVDGQES